jgi:hypothetical protein
LKQKLKSLSLVAGAILAFTAMAGSMAADRVLSADEVKKLISGNTVRVTQINNAKQWSIFFAADGKGYESKDQARGTWEIKENGEHCASWAVLKCAKVADIGGGKYARIKPNGDHAVTWTIEAGNKL